VLLSSPLITIIEDAARVCGWVEWEGEEEMKKYPILLQLYSQNQWSILFLLLPLAKA